MILRQECNAYIKSLVPFDVQRALESRFEETAEVVEDRLQQMRVIQCTCILICSFKFKEHFWIEVLGYISLCSLAYYSYPSE